MGGLVGYIDSTDVAFDGREMGVFMVLMAILGGKGTLWGPVIGATVFHIFKEGFWTFFLGWQYVALGVLIVVIVIYFPEGIMGWLREKYPERFGEVVDEADRKAQVELKSVVLPDPLGPINPTILPFSTFIEISTLALTPPNDLLTLLTSKILI